MLWSVSDWGQARSVPLQSLAPVFELEEVQLYSLQQGQAANDPWLHRFDIDQLSPRTASLPLAALAMSQLDVVITPDAMAAHLAGALGRPTWVMLLHEADWRWMADRDDSPWYPTARLFRQPRAGDWEGVALAMADALQELCKGRVGQAELAQPTRKQDKAGYRSRSPAAPATNPPPSPPR